MRYAYATKQQYCITNGHCAVCGEGRVADINQDAPQIGDMYYCNKCDSTYRIILSNLGCLVEHNDGACCHYGPEKIQPEKCVPTTSTADDAELLNILEDYRIDYPTEDWYTGILDDKKRANDTAILRLNAWRNQTPPTRPVSAGDDGELHKIIARHDGWHGIVHNVMGGKLLSEEHCANCRETARSIQSLIAAQNNAIYEAVLEAIPTSYAKSVGLDVAQLWGSQDATDGYNQACSDLRQAIAKIYGKEVNDGR